MEGDETRHGGGTCREGSAYPISTLSRAWFPRNGRLIVLDQKAKATEAVEVRDPR